MWQCTVGHGLRDLDTDTELRVLDGSAQIRVCTEHGTPVWVEAHDTESHIVPMSQQ